MKLWKVLVWSAFAGVANSAVAVENVRHDEGIGFYVGIDGRATIPTGTFAGLANPNYNRLSLLLDHGDHYHRIGAYSYTGTAAAPTVVNTSTNNTIPEPGSRQPPMMLEMGTGTYAGKYRSITGSSEYAYFGIAPSHLNNGFAPGSDEYVLFNSSDGVYTGSLDGVTVGLRLLSYTPGMKVGTRSDTDIFDTGSIYTLGSGDDFNTFRPIFWVDGSAPHATAYSATFQLLNLSPNTEPLDSGTFSFNFMTPAPEPETWALMAIGLVGISVIARRRAKQAQAS